MEYIFFYSGTITVSVIICMLLFFKTLAEIKNNRLWLKFGIVSSVFLALSINLIILFSAVLNE